MIEAMSAIGTYPDIHRCTAHVRFRGKSGHDQTSELKNFVARFCDRSRPYVGGWQGAGCDFPGHTSSQCAVRYVKRILVGRRSGQPSDVMVGLWE